MLAFQKIMDWIRYWFALDLCLWTSIIVGDSLVLHETKEVSDSLFSLSFIFLVSFFFFFFFHFLVAI